MHVHFRRLFQIPNRRSVFVNVDYRRIQSKIGIEGQLMLLMFCKIKRSIEKDIDTQDVSIMYHRL